MDQQDIEQMYCIIKSDTNAPTVMTDLLGLIGMNRVKQQFARLYYHSKLAKNYDSETLPAFSYNAIFRANAGAGKSCVARMYFELMKELGQIPKSSIFIEEAGSSLVDRGADGLQTLLRSIRGSKGAVVCIDDAHQLLVSRAGRQALAALLPLAAQHETQYGRIVWILAGPSGVIDALLGARAVLLSRFPVRMTFDDFTEEELLAMFLSKLKLFKRAATMTDQVASARQYSLWKAYSPVSLSFCCLTG
jgi:hypothetical protein